MGSSGDTSQVAAALRYLRERDISYWFDSKERVIGCAVGDEPGADELASYISRLPDLREVQFSDADLTDVGLHRLAPLRKLRKLDLDCPQVKGDGLACLAGMTRLADLDLSGNQLDGRGFEHLARLKRLVELRIEGGTCLDEHLRSLGSLSMLEELSLTNSDTITGTFAEHLAGLQHLRNLTCERHVTDEGLACIAQLSNLETLYIEGSFTDIGLLHLRALQRLETLGVISEHFTHVGASMVAELPELKSLHFEIKTLSDEIVPFLLQCTKLEDLSFRHACLTEGAVQRLREGLPGCSVRDDERDRYEGATWRAEDDVSCYQSDTPFATLVEKASDWDLVNCTFSKISDRYKNQVDASAYSPVERVIMLGWHVSGIIGNGGFDFLFAWELPGDPDLRLSAEACKEAGLVRSYEAFQEAFSLFPGGIVPHDPKERRRLYGAANRSARDLIDGKHYRDDGDNTRRKKLAEYIRAHAAELAYLD